MVDHKSIEAFNTKFFANTKQLLAKFGNIDSLANHGRCRCMEQSNPMADWPYDDVYTPFGSVASGISIIEDKDFMGRVLAERLSGTFGEASLLTSYYLHLITQNLLQTVVHVPAINEVDMSKLSQSSMVLTKQPQWSYLFNVMDHNYTGDIGTIGALSICKNYRYIGKWTELQHTLSVATFNTNCEMMSVYDIPIRSDLTISDSIDALVENQKSYYRKGMLGERKSKKQADIASRLVGNSSTLILNYLMYLLDNLDKLKDSSGNAATLRPNPERTADSPLFEDYKIYAQYDSPLHLYLD